MRLSYAQLLEDYHLDLALGDRAEGVYVDVGAGHPVADNVSFHFYLKGWRGLIVEPQAELARLYRPLRPRDVVIDHLVGNHEGTATFHQVERLHGFSTMIPAHAEGARAFGAGYRSCEMRVRPLASLIDEAGLAEIDFLKVDVEGAEADVLAGMDWKRHRPKILCIEAVRPGSGEAAHAEWEGLLSAASYRLAFADGLNRFYVAEEWAELATRFPRTPAPWDVVRHLYEFGRPVGAAHHPDHALTARLVRGFLAGLPFLDRAAILEFLDRSAGQEGVETGEDLARLVHGTADFPGRAAAAGDPLEDDRFRAALGRIAAAYDGGMIWDEENTPAPEMER